MTVVLAIRVTVIGKDAIHACDVVDNLLDVGTIQDAILESATDLGYRFSIDQVEVESES